jgi:predicted transcriptional regulator
MKTAISLPDDLFRRAEALARKLGVPRSRLYALALEEYLGRHGPANVTADLDRVYEDQPSDLDPLLATLQGAVIDEVEW